MNGEIYFDMTREQHPTGSESKVLLKRWKKYTIYAKSGSYVHGNSSRTSVFPSSSGESVGWVPFTDTSDSANENAHASCSVYLYDYVAVSKEWYSSMVYTASIVDSTPAGIDDIAPGAMWIHRENTFRNSPNAETNNYLLTYNPILSNVASYNRPIYTEPFIFKQSDTYFEIVKGYPRNHFTHKRDIFSLYNVKTEGPLNFTSQTGSYIRNRQTITSTVGENGLEDGSSPVQSIQVGNLDFRQTDNAIN